MIPHSLARMIRALKSSVLLASSTTRRIPARGVNYKWEPQYEFIPKLRPQRKYKERFAPEPLDTEETYTDVVESAEDFKYVLPYLPRDTIPPLPAETLTNYPTPSGFIPPLPQPPALPYFIGRTVYHNLPVYSFATDPSRFFTRIKYVEGDIWEFQRNLVDFLRDRLPEYEGLIATKVDEAARQVWVKGDIVGPVKEFLLESGF